MEVTQKEEIKSTDRLLEFDLSAELNHGIAVSNLAYAVAKELGQEEEFCYQLAIAGMLHDIGKLKLTGYINGRERDPLLIEELKYVRMHSTLGYEELRDQDYSEIVLQSILYHHENYDGSGYPFRMSGESIPIGSRIIRICDVFTALVSDRSYRKAFDAETAMRMVIDEVRHFDMKIFLVFMELVNTTDVVREIQDIIHSKNNYDKAWSEIM